MQKAYDFFKIPIIGMLFLVSACTSTQEQQEIADVVFTNGTSYTMDNTNPMAEAVAVRGDKIIFAGSKEQAEKFVGENTKEIDLKGNTMTPGFIESHGHMMGMGYEELNLDVSNVKNYDELVAKVAEAVKKAQPGEWIVGRGWHQSKWDPAPQVMVKGFQTHLKLSAVSPDNPVWLTHASGHAGFANAKAMEIAGVNPLSVESMNQKVEGGEIVTDENGNPTGIFSETAQSLITKHIPQNTPEKNRQALELAIKACQRNGITTFNDAGADKGTIDLYQQFRDEGILGVRMYVMISGRNEDFVNEWLKRGIMVDTSQHLLTVRSIKLYADGALGNRGAWLLEPYTDRPGHYGFAVTPMEYIGKISKEGLEAGFQINTHAIGDRANREVLDQYQAAFEAFPEKAGDVRFRIEHAQHLSLQDIPRFAQLGVIASMQTIHMSSDRPWAIDRLGEQRIKDGAYVWQKLLQSGAKVINGTDVPVEPINPMANFFAAVTRKTLKGTPEGGYEPDQKMTREQALRSYTLDGAYGDFTENINGSIEPGKLADFTVFDQDIMTIPDDQILGTHIAMTILGGKVVYEKQN